MLGKQILAKEIKDSSNKDNVMNSESRHRVLINWSPFSEPTFFLQHGSPRVLSKSVPRRNKGLFQYRINRSLNFDVIRSRKNSWSKSSNSSLDDGDNSFEKDKLSRGLSRSAKIMRALSFDLNSSSHRNMSIKRSLNFDSTPSPEKSNSNSSNSHTDSINAKLSNLTNSSLGEFLKLEANSSDSTANSALESMDENQNQTPKQNRKIIKISNDETSDTKKNANESELCCSTSSFLSSSKEDPDNIICMTQTPDLQSLKQDNKSRAFNCVIIASTPRNLFQEFNQDEDNRPCTPENVMHLIPQSISSIKKSHKKEKLCYNEEESFARQINVSIRKEKNTNIQTLESLRIDVSTNASCSNASIIKSQKKNKSVKKTLIYDLDDKLLDTTSGFGDDAQWKTTSRKNDSPESRRKTKNTEVQGITSIDYEKSDEDSSSIHFGSHNSEEKNCSNKSSCDKEVHQLPLQEESLNISEVNENETNENREVSTESNSPTSQSFTGTGTPENNFNILEHLHTESIKKSHKKIKHENRKALFKTKFLHDKITAESEIAAQNSSNNDQCEDIKNKTLDAIFISGSQNSNRPNTPENVNSSRLLLPLFKSVKKSHKKDKHGKKIYHFSKSYKYEDLTNTSKTLNKSLKLEGSPDISGPNKKRKSKDISLLSITCKSPSLEYKDASDEFKIYTPIKRMSSSLFMNRVYEDKTSQEDPIQMTSKEINCSRCVTPVIHIRNYSGKLRENNDLTNASVLKDTPTDTLKIKNGRSTPIHMSTTELLDDVNSIKKSHKKIKHDRSVHRRRILEKKQSFTKKSRNGNVSSAKVLEEHNTSLSFKSLNVNNYCTEMEIYSDILDEKQSESRNETVQSSPQPSTSQGSDSTQDATNIEKSGLLSTTPSNDLSAVNLMKMLHTTSIKKSHRKERDHNAQAKYILMSKEHEELSDDGSIFDEDDRLHCTKSYNSCQDSDEMII